MYHISQADYAVRYNVLQNCVKLSWRLGLHSFRPRYYTPQTPPFGDSHPQHLLPQERRLQMPPPLLNAFAVIIDVINVFYVFYSGHVFTFLTFFISSTFLFKKKRCNAKYKYVKIQRKIFSEDDLAIIFIDFGLLRSLYCKISYLLPEEHWSHTNLGIWQPTYDSVCKGNSWIHGKCRQRFLSNVYKRFFLFSPRF